MVAYWKSLSSATKWSAVAFIVTGALGLLSMGLLGLGLYYLVAFVFSDYPDVQTWHGDWVWPGMIGAGMLWSLGFVWAGLLWFFLSKYIKWLIVLRLIYIFTLWLWAVLVWAVILKTNL